jgi:hypothetical protein
MQTVEKQLHERRNNAEVRLVLDLLHLRCELAKEDLVVEEDDQRRGAVKELRDIIKKLTRTVTNSDQNP